MSHRERNTIASNISLSQRRMHTANFRYRSCCAHSRRQQATISAQPWAQTDRRSWEASRRLAPRWVIRWRHGTPPNDVRHWLTATGSRLRLCCFVLFRSIRVGTHNARTISSKTQSGYRRRWTRAIVKCQLLLFCSLLWAFLTNHRKLSSYAIYCN